ncbi:MAG: hypothetical protein LUI02_06735 [Clostridiales bacterium]|nr:hypothetical protein [Clostridiales bacterium]
MVKVFVAVPIGTEEETGDRLRSVLHMEVLANPDQLIMMTNEPEDLMANWEECLTEAEEAAFGTGWESDDWCRVAHDEAVNIGRPVREEGSI